MSYNGIILNGATAVGKTDLSIKLAELLNCEIISADSTQIYKGLDILTSKITEKEKCGINHYLLDIVDIFEEYSVYNFKIDVENILNKLNGKDIIIVGGTGLYTNVINNGLSILPEKNDELRTKLEKLKLDDLLLLLKEKDEKALELLDINNKVRVVRALEICILSGKKYSEVIGGNNKNHNYTFFNVFLTRNRDELYERINKRVDIMFKNGAIKEGKIVYEKYKEKMKEIKAIGYFQMYKYFNSLIDYEEMIEEIKKQSRHYAKRQITWFKNKGYYEINISNKNEVDILNEIITKYKEFKNGNK